MKEIKQFIKRWGVSLLAFLGIIFIALLLRTINLTILPIFGDEAIYIRWSQVMGAEPGLRFLPLSDGKQPLFMWVLMFLVRRFQDPLFIGRLTSVFYGIGTLVGIFTLSFTLFRSKKVSLISSLFWAVSPFSIFYDRLALVDSMLTMFGVWTLTFSVFAVKSLRLDYAMLAGFSLGGALLTKSPGIYFALMLPLSWIVSRWPKRKKGVGFGKKGLFHLSKLISLTFATSVIGFVMYNILRLGENFHLVTSRNKDYVYPISQLWTSPLHPFVENIKEIFNWFWKLSPSVLIVFLLVILIINIKHIKKRPKGELALLFLWSAIPIIVSSIYAKALTARYVLFALPSVFIIASLLFSKGYKLSESFRKVVMVGLFIYILQAFYINYFLLTNPELAPLPRVLRSGYLEEWTSGVGIKEVADIIIEEYKINPSKNIIVGTEGYFGTLPDGLQAYLNDYREITVIGTGLDFKEIPESLVESKRAGNTTYFVVNSSRLVADPSDLNLSLIAVYPKAFRPDQTRESLFLFEVLEETSVNSL